MPHVELRHIADGRQVCYALYTEYLKKADSLLDTSRDLLDKQSWATESRFAL